MKEKRIAADAVLVMQFVRGRQYACRKMKKDLNIRVSTKIYVFAAIVVLVYAHLNYNTWT